jgi:hypothetical protein
MIARTEYVLLRNEAGARSLAREKPAHDTRFCTWRDQDLPYAFVERVHSGFELGLHTARGDAFQDQLSGLSARQDGTNGSVFIANAFNIRQKEKGIGCEGRRAGRRHLIRIHVVYSAARIAGDACDHGQICCPR